MPLRAISVRAGKVRINGDFVDTFAVADKQILTKGVDIVCQCRSSSYRTVLIYYRDGNRQFYSNVFNSL